MIGFRNTFVVCGLAAMLTGCASKPIPVSGTVTRGGQPLPAGYVTFEPDSAAGTTGPGATGVVDAGAFALPPDHTLTPGKYLVRIGPPLLGSGADKKLVATSFKPWETTVEIPAGGGVLTFDVPTTTTPAPTP
ncbi:MAG: hypothetical protein K8U57_02495 [Planctomycetes bacterium]|nr:hypothetical protein [Planctomycetota bacterium]